jgi:hypothetical protein
VFGTVGELVVTAGCTLRTDGNPLTGQER